MCPVCALNHPLNKGASTNLLDLGTVAPSTIWSVIECAVAIICACLPNLMPLVRLVWSRCHCSRQSRDREWPDPPEHRNDGTVALNRKHGVNGSTASGNVAGSGAGSNDSAARGMVSVEQVFV